MGPGIGGEKLLLHSVQLIRQECCHIVTGSIILEGRKQQLYSASFLKCTKLPPISLPDSYLQIIPEDCQLLQSGVKSQRKLDSFFSMYCGSYVLACCQVSKLASCLSHNELMACCVVLFSRKQGVHESAAVSGSSTHHSEASNLNL
jgi:hypothetical protein